MTLRDIDEKVHYGFKACPVAKEQIADRMRMYDELGLDHFFCELYLDGIDISSEKIKKKILCHLPVLKGRCSIHVPVVDHKEGFFDPLNFKSGCIDNAADLARRFEAHIIVLHRCWGFNSEIEWEEAEKRFNNWILEIAKDYEDLTFLIENFGFVFRIINGESKSFMSPLDHFFPQEMVRFNEWISKNGIKNVYPFLDTAHANLTLNLLKAWDIDPDYAKGFVHSSLHEKIKEKAFYINCLEDYVSKGLYPYFHVNDSCSLRPDALTSTWLDHFMSEGIVPGRGDIEWGSLLTKIHDLFDDVIIIMEVDMKNPVNGIEQKEGIEFIRRLIQDLKREMRLNEYHSHF
jgi:sugar phosphate isomerase/epimerase